MKKQQLQKYLPFALALALPAALFWYYDVYVNWNPVLCCIAVAALLLCVAALTLLVLRARGETKPRALAWKTLLSVAVFAAALVGVSGIINNALRIGAKTAAATALPLAAAQILVLFALRLRLPRKPTKAIICICAAMACLLSCIFTIGVPFYMENYGMKNAAVRDGAQLDFELWDYSQEPAGGTLLNIDINSVNIPFLNSVVDTATPNTVREALQPFVAQYANTQITDVLFNIFCQYSAAPSEVYTTDVDKYLQTSENGVPVDYKEIFHASYTLSQWGVDPFEVWIAQCRELGMRPWISLRMNDCHEPDDETNWLRGDFFYEARENGWMIGEDYGYFRNCFDYAVPEVREKMLAYIEEQFMRYDVHGLELDWMREITCFKEQGRPENVEIINDFMRRVDKLRHMAQEKWGHEIKIMCRLPRDYTQSVIYGFDAAAWAKEGLVNAIVVTPRWESNDSAMPLHQWRAALTGSDVKIYAGLEILTNRAAVESHSTARTAQGYAAQYLSAGADAIYLFNYFQNPNEPSETFREVYNTCGSMDTLLGARRRHVVTFQDIAPKGVGRFRPLPMKVTKTKPQSLLVHTGSFEAEELTIYLGLKPNANAESLRVYLNGKQCEYLGKTALPEEDKANYLREEADIYAWRAVGPFSEGAQSVTVHNNLMRSVAVSYVEICID